jgi:hypothetical protein
LPNMDHHMVPSMPHFWASKGAQPPASPWPQGPKNFRPTRRASAKKRNRQRMNNGYSAHELALTAPWWREGREKGGRGDAVLLAVVVFVLLNPYSAAVYCQQSILSNSAPKAGSSKSGEWPAGVFGERGRGKSSEKLHGETSNHFSVYCKTYHEQARREALEAKVLFELVSAPWPCHRYQHQQQPHPHPLPR